MILPWTMNKEFLRIEAQQNINDPYLSLDLQQVQGVKGVKARQSFGILIWKPYPVICTKNTPDFESIFV